VECDLVTVCNDGRNGKAGVQAVCMGPPWPAGVLIATSRAVHSFTYADLRTNAVHHTVS
jgi:hypothetical protein